MKRLLTLLAASLVAFAAFAHSEENGFRANFVPDMVSNPDICDTPGFATKNHDIWGYVKLINRQMLELSMSASAQISEIRPSDRGRINEYIARLEGYQVQVNEQDPSDYAGTHTLYYCLTKIENPPLVTNPIITRLNTKMTLIVGELLKSNSTNLPADLTASDNARLTDMIEDLKSYVLYIDSQGPQDYPRQAVLTEYIEETAGIARKAPAPQ